MNKKQDTREILLDSAFNAFYKHGFQGAKIDAILNDVGINKGSMYYFFKSKKELGLAVIKERLERAIQYKFNAVLEYEGIVESEYPLKKLFDTLRNAPNSLMYGCPLNKMTQEMLYIDKDFKKLLSNVYKNFENTIEKILNKANISNPTMSAKLIISTFEGALMIYHLNQDENEFREILTAFEKELFTLNK